VVLRFWGVVLRFWGAVLGSGSGEVWGRLQSVSHLCKDQRFRRGEAVNSCLRLTHTHTHTHVRVRVCVRACDTHKAECRVAAADGSFRATQDPSLAPWRRDGDDRCPYRRDNTESETERRAPKPTALELRPL